MNVVEIRGLRKRFRVPRGAGGGQVRAVDGLDLDVGRGEVVGLVGESGCGKSTVAQCLLRLLEPDEGSIMVDGLDISHVSGARLRAVRPKMHMVFQDPFSSLNPRMRVRDIVAGPLRSQKSVGRRSLPAAVDEVLGQVGLDPRLRDRYPHELSGGQRQRVGLARSLAARPLLLVADEPTSALDVSVQAAILNQVSDLQASLGFSCLFISHDLAVVEYLCDRIAVMYLGQIVETGTRDQIFRAPRHPYTKALLSASLSAAPGNGAGPGAETGAGAARRRVVLAGELPDPRDPPPGCPFHTRCPIAQFPLCRNTVPARIAVASGHWATCHFAAEA